MPNTDTLQPQSAAKSSIFDDSLGGWRKAKDRLANFTITAGGMAVLLAILLIFFYLLYEIIPLFKSASLKPVSSYSLEDSRGAGSEPLYLAMEEQAEVAVQLRSNGQIDFFAANSGKTVKQFQLPLTAELTAFSLHSEQQPLLAMATGGDVLLAKPVYKISYPNDKRLITPQIEYPYGEEGISVSEGTINKIAVRDTEEQLLLLAEVGGQLEGIRLVKEEDFLTEEILLEEEILNLPEIDINIEWLLVGPDQRWGYVVSKRGDYRVINLNSEEIVDSGRLIAKGQVTNVRFLLGEISLMISSDQGEIQQWFMVRADGEPPRLQNIRSFQGSDSAIKLTAPEHRRKGFLAVDSDNTLAVYHTTSGRQLLSQSIADASSNITQLAISPRAKALLTQNEKGEFSYWKLDNEHPEVSWQALWEKVWYESYPEPDYIWQSSASNNDFEAKYSFTPLAFGTLKAAFYAMLIATPLALCGAIYTAYFMTPVVRRKVKPLIELMEALPTVILGFLAGLWLAPFIEKNLPGVFSIFLLMPVGVLLFGFCWSRLPDSLRLRVPDGWHAVLLIPVVMFIAWACVAASGNLELLFFGGDMRAWLTYDLGVSYDQRNAMVVGVAMGFAVVPTIFSIAEDAIFSVPKSLSYGSLALGATPWQTLVGVVIPTASPGIFSALMIGMGRAVGETMIVLMATGNTPVMDANIFEGMRTLAANIAVEIGETEVDSSHYRVLFLAAFVLFLFTFVVNTIAEIVRQSLRKKYGSL
ncbi:MAG: ABC transporter permease subunit [Oceanicoccus sp.]|uniref:ABC transporter permease subunit n=1 Tax=Oceanicoccus sp. TaxID=2691044 RepID=UPI002611F7C1|nr:ABC transporter permease subunit [Oceanicoccus sp.]MCP3908209.1 ABC transporter permease subunit [Oceanicoccus sp.]